jgi:hypothetical protein
MKGRDYMQEKLEKLRLNKFLEIRSWAGLSPMPGTTGIIITKDKKIYYYHKYHHVPENLKDKIKLEDISEGRVIDEDIYLKLVNYLEEKVIGKEFEYIRIMDAGVKISGTLNNNSFNIDNHFDIYNDLKRIIDKKVE